MYYLLFVVVDEFLLIIDDHGHMDLCNVCFRVK